MGTQSLSLKWNSHQRNLIDVFEQLLWNEDLVDVTLACEGITLKAHKTVLSACSPFFHTLFLDHPCKHPVIIMKDVKYTDLKSIIEFMYKGEIIVSQDRLTDFLKTAETLKVKGLTETSNNQSDKFTQQENISSQPNTSQTLHAPADEPRLDTNYIPQKKRKRTRTVCRGSSNDLSDDEHQSSNKEMHYHTVTDSSKTIIDCSSSDVSQERVSVSQNLHEDIVSILPKDSPSTFDVPMVDAENNIEISNILENHLREQNVQILPSSGLHSQQNKPTLESSNLLPAAVHSLDDGVSNSRSIMQEHQKDMNPASLLTFQDSQSTYKGGLSQADDDNLAITSVKIETSPDLNTYAECEQPHEEDHSQECYPSATRCENATNCAYMRKSIEAKQPSDWETGSQYTKNYSRKSELNKNVTGNITKTLETNYVQLEYKETIQKSSVYTCAFCHKIFSYNSQLLSHLMTHSSERPHACNQCDKSFKYRRNLRTHQRIQHDVK